jgi:hypothetical protein
MSYSNALMTGLLRSGSLGALTTSGANETQKVTTPSGLTDALLQRYALSGRVGLAEKWIPVGLWYTITTTTTVNVGVVTLRKNGVSAATGGTANIIVAAAATTELFSPFTDYTFAAAWAAADQWSVLVTTTQGAGVIGASVGTYLAYVNAAQVGLTDGIAE